MMIFLNSNNGKIQFVFLLVICCNIFLEKPCHAQFHWAKSGRREATMLKELLQDLAQEAEESGNGLGVLIISLIYFILFKSLKLNQIIINLGE